jgi:hypothetical protein
VAVEAVGGLDSATAWRPRWLRFRVLILKNCSIRLYLVLCEPGSSTTGGVSSLGEAKPHVANQEPDDATPRGSEPFPKARSWQEKSTSCALRVPAESIVTAVAVECVRHRRW